MAFLTKLLRFWFFGAFLILAIWFALSNQERYAISLKPWIEHISLPAWIVVTGSFALGAVLASVAFGVDSLGKAMQIRRLTKTLRDVQSTSAGTSTSLTLGAGPSISPGDGRP